MIDRLQGRYRDVMARFFFKHTLCIESPVPMISFTFDDFPRSALLAGGAILESFGYRGTFYASMGEMGNDSEVGGIFRPEDLTLLISKSHELGCHTFDHLDPWRTDPDIFEQSILKNAIAARELLPEFAFRTFAYPFRQPHPYVKKRASRHFLCCRGGGQKPNIVSMDLHLLNAVFLERSRENPDGIKGLIDENCRARGWLIFVTHDISHKPSQWGCEPAFFEDIVRYSARSGSTVLSVIQACEALTRARPVRP